MCATGKSLWDAWTKYADMVNLLAVRSTGGLFTHLKEDVVVPLSHEEAYSAYSDEFGQAFQFEYGHRFHSYVATHSSVAWPGLDRRVVGAVEKW